MLTPKIDPSVFVAKGAIVLGDVTIEKDCSIWYNATVRSTESYIKIGKGSNVQDNAVIHVSHDYPTTIGSYVTIGHGAIIHGCSIDDNVSIIVCQTIDGKHKITIDYPFLFALIPP